MTRAEASRLHKAEPIGTVDPCSKCASCGHSRWLHMDDGQGKSFDFIGTDGFAYYRVLPTSCGKCACKQYEPG
jgi:hypothetical protein